MIIASEADYSYFEEVRRGKRKPRDEKPKEGKRPDRGLQSQHLMKFFSNAAWTAFDDTPTVLLFPSSSLKGSQANSFLSFLGFLHYLSNPLLPPLSRRNFLVFPPPLSLIRFILDSLPRRPPFVLPNLVELSNRERFRLERYA